MVELEIERVIWRGRGLARIKDGRRAIVLPPVFPGEVIRGSIIREKRDYVEVRPKEILSPSPIRRDHPCKYSHMCGGCTFGHIKYKEQLRLKREILVHQLSRHLGQYLNMEMNPISQLYPSPERWGYRWRGQVVVKNGVPHLQRLGTNLLISFDKCLLYCHPLNDSLGDRCRNLPDGRAILATSPVDMATYTHRDKGPLLLPVYGCAHPLEIPPSCFFQANQNLNAHLVRWVVNELKGEETIIDLFAGSGNFALPLSLQHKDVIMVEKEEGALEAAKRFAKAHGLELGTERIDLFRDAALKEFLKRIQGRGAEALIVDPPRIGGRSIPILVEGIRSLKKIVWVSCDVINTCRDVLPLLKKGWRISKMAIFDMFPQTYHVEVVFVIIPDQGEKGVGYGQ